MKTPQILELRPEPKGGLWVRAVVDSEARHDHRLTESVEFTFYLSDCLEVTVGEALRRAEKEVEAFVRALQAV